MYVSIAEAARYEKLREAARAAGQPTYSGRPCAYGHTIRHVRDNECQACRKRRARAQHVADALYRRWWRAQNPDKVRVYAKRHMRTYYQRHPERKGADRRKTNAVFKATHNSLRAEGILL